MTNSKTKIRHASLFSGIGAAEAAADALGWENVFHCEINPFGRKVLAYWFPESESHEDIRKTDFTKYRGRIDVLTGGFPCQPFSTAGKRRGAKDDRYLWPEMLRAIDEIRPAWVVGENVAGITTMVEAGILTSLGVEAALFEEGDGVHRYLYSGTFTIERVCRDLERAGYSVQPVLIPAAAVGAPHRRDRIYIIAHLEDPIRMGQRFGKDEEQGCERDERHACAGDSQRVCRKADADAPDPSDTGPEGVRQKRKDGIYGSFASADAHRERLQVSREPGGHGEEERDGEERPVGMLAHDVWAEGAWFDGFPSISPVHAGNDGLPFDVAGLTIPFGRWREESIKACGNAIVPQVMYEIFKAIEKITKEQE